MLFANICDIMCVQNKLNITKWNEIKYKCSNHLVCKDKSTQRKKKQKKQKNKKIKKNKKKIKKIKKKKNSKSADPVLQQ